MELPDNPMRWDIIQYLIDKYDYKDYLEIGYYKAYCFDNIKCLHKTAVDPNPCKTPEQEKMPYDTTDKLVRSDKEGFFRNSEFIVKLTSDDFFKIKDQYPNDKELYSLIFIDGLHDYQTVYRDIQNSLRYLSPGGIILLHDMLPPTYTHTTTGDQYGNWNGDCYKALLQFIQNDFLGHYQVYTIDTDWGIGVIKPHEGTIAPIERYYSLDYNKAIENWDYFDNNRNELLNVISVEEFKKIF